MITGKDDDRYKFVNIAIANFMQQTYINKHLIIVNHGQRDLSEKESENITQIKFDKNKLTLGDMRNFSLEMVPYGSLWTTWDDDDWRHSKYLELLYKHMKDKNADVVFFKNRIDFNLSNRFAYRCKFERGMPFVLCKKFEPVQYLSKDSLEDVRLFNDFEMYKKNISVINNDPRWYIRTIHGKNTSVYVDGGKDYVVNYSSESLYHEYEITEKERMYVEKIIEENFNGIF